MIEFIISLFLCVLGIYFFLSDPMGNLALIICLFLAFMVFLIGAWDGSNSWGGYN